MCHFNFSVNAAIIVLVLSSSGVFHYQAMELQRLLLVQVVLLPVQVKIIFLDTVILSL